MDARKPAQPCGALSSTAFGPYSPQPAPTELQSRALEMSCNSLERRPPIGARGLSCHKCVRSVWKPCEITCANGRWSCAIGVRRRGTIGPATAQTHFAFSPSAIPSPSQDRYRSRVLLDQLAHLVVSLSAIRHPIAAGSWTSWRVRVVLSNDTARGRVLRSNCRRGRDGSSQRTTNSRARPVRNCPWP